MVHMSSPKRQLMRLLLVFVVLHNSVHALLDLPYAFLTPKVHLDQYRFTFGPYEAMQCRHTDDCCAKWAEKVRKYIATYSKSSKDVTVKVKDPYLYFLLDSAHVVSTEATCENNRQPSGAIIAGCKFSCQTILPRSEIENDHKLYIFKMAADPVRKVRELRGFRMLCSRGEKAAVLEVNSLWLESPSSTRKVGICYNDDEAYSQASFLAASRSLGASPAIIQAGTSVCSDVGPVTLNLIDRVGRQDPRMAIPMDLDRAQLENVVLRARLLTIHGRFGRQGSN